MSREMKNSGIPWIGDIPKVWNIDTIGNLYTLRNEKVSDKDYPPLSVTKMGIVPQLETAAKTDDGGKESSGNNVKRLSDLLV